MLKNLLKIDPETTAVVYFVGEKDGRLGGKYFQKYTNDMEGFDKWIHINCSKLVLLVN